MAAPFVERRLAKPADVLVRGCHGVLDRATDGVDPQMLNPRSIAIVVATPRIQYGGRFLAARSRPKTGSQVYAVNPRYDEIMGVKSYASVTDLPEAPDVVGHRGAVRPGARCPAGEPPQGAASAIVDLGGLC